jgi:hypothetical protein
MTRQSPYAWPTQPSRAPQHAAEVNGNAVMRGRAHRVMKLALIASVWVAGLFVVVAAVTMVAMATAPVARTSGGGTPVQRPAGGHSHAGDGSAAGNAGIGGYHRAGDGQGGTGQAGTVRSGPGSGTGRGRTGDSRTGPGFARHRAAAAGTSAPTRVHAVYAFTGSADTSQFTIGGNGTWKIAWSYSCAGLDPKGSFTVGQDGASSVDGAYITRLGATGRGVTWAYKDAGTHYLAIRTQCRWRITVTS